MVHGIWTQDPWRTKTWLYQYAMEIYQQDCDIGRLQKLNFAMQNCYKIVSSNNICQLKSAQNLTEF